MSANGLPHLTANALLDAEEAVKPQLEDWLEKPQRHEWLAVGDVASQYDAKTRISRYRNGDDSRRIIPAGPSSSLVMEESDMDDDRGKLQGHEWLIGGDIACPVRIETKTTPEDHGKDLGRRVLAGLMDSTMKKENSRPEGGTNKPAKHELLALGGCGSNAPTKMDGFLADIDEILSGKAE